MSASACFFRRGLVLGGLAIAAVGCAAESEPVSPELAADVPVAQCLELLASGREPSACPGFLTGPLTDAVQLCREVGGRPIAIEPPTIWAIDVNSDGRQEYAFELDGVVGCENAWSVYSCGSLGCPKALYEERDGAWQFIGALHASTPESLVLDTSTATAGYHPFYIGCAPGASCEASSQYAWRDGRYESTAVIVRGHRVETERSVHGLYALLAETAVLAEPAAGASALDTYAPGTEVAIIGTAEAAAYYYVSPCNACMSGFIPTTAVAAR
jgi:hypothetical protein